MIQLAAMARRDRDPNRHPYVVGYDGSEAAAAAVRFARMLASTAGAEVVAASVYPVVPHVYAPGASAMADAELAEALRMEAQAKLDALPGQDITRTAIPGESAAEGLHRLAEERHAALLAVGVTHRSALGRLLVGGVGDRLLHGAPCPLAVVPARWDDETCRTVGVAFDGREQSQTAVRAAEGLALRLGAKLVVIGVYDPQTLLWLESPDPAPSLFARAELRRGFDQVLDGVVAGLDPATEPEARTRGGVPGPALVKASHDVDLLVMGSRGYGPLNSVLLGSVSRYVADHAVCPLLVVPRTAGVDEPPDVAEHP